MRSRRRRPIAFAFASALVGLAGFAALPACDSPFTGQLAEDPGPPVLMKLLIQDELPSGGRNAATDLLDKTPTITCAEDMPCPVGDKFSHPLCDVGKGVCPDPLNPAQTPPAIGV